MWAGARLAVRGCSRWGGRAVGGPGPSWSRWLHASPSAASNEAVIAVGSNLGSRAKNIWSGLNALASRGDAEVLQYGGLYETKPAYFDDQGDFLNTAVLVRTDLQPLDLLDALKGIEASSGRDLDGGGVRFGPRTLDLDIVFFGSGDFDDERLAIPHPRWRERAFVLAPLADLEPAGGGACSERLAEAKRAWSDLGGEAAIGGDDIRRVTPIGSSKVASFHSKSHVMGILNVTPDSFSDGGLFETRARCLERCHEMVLNGAGIIDVGGQSTRPGADLVPPEEEAERVLPIIEAIKADPDLASKALVSVDTFHSKVARLAVNAGADIVNDVTAGAFDEAIIDVVAESATPYVMMHMRGGPKTMQSKENTTYGDGGLVPTIARELGDRVELAVRSGLMPWCVITDPGIGFAKTHAQNLELLSSLCSLRQSFEPTFLRKQPMLVGPSRKGFLGVVAGRPDPKDRDAATSAALVIAAANECNIFRAHNVTYAADALKVADAVSAAGAVGGRNQ